MPHSIRRCELATPGSNPRMLKKAAASGVDMAFLDLEDAVAESAKEGARDTVVEALTQLDWGSTVRAVRINGLDTPWCYRDIISVVERAGEYLDTIIIPKARSAADIGWVDTLLTQVEMASGLTRPIRLEALIEDAAALENCSEIARASTRMDALILGVGDMSVSLGARTDVTFDPHFPYPGDFWHYARVRVVSAARAAGLQAIDGPYPNFADPEGFVREARRAAVLGFTGKWAIHPSQIQLATEVFTPSEPELDRARDMVGAYEAGAAEGRGAVALAGQLVDAAHVKAAATVLDRHAAMVALANQEPMGTRS